MHNFGTYLLGALVGFTLCHGSLAEDHQSGYVCLIDDPNPNQSESVCLTQNKAKFAVQAKLEGQLQGLEIKLEEVQTKMKESQAELGGKLLAVETKLEQQQAVLTKIKNQLIAIFNKIEAPKQAAKIPSGFEQIGTRYFLIVEEVTDWYNAKRLCGEKGGYLASFRDEKEITAIATKLTESATYWLGINDSETEGHYVSVASQKPASFLNWHNGLPNDKDHILNCVLLYEGNIMYHNCDLPHRFICQADNEF